MLDVLSLSALSYGQVIAITFAECGAKRNGTASGDAARGRHPSDHP